MRNQQNVKVRVNSNFETICPFPVGYVYMSSNSTSPADIYGGTWASISGGRYMRAASAWGNGGSNTITIDNMPNHTHSLGVPINTNALQAGGRAVQLSAIQNGSAEYGWVKSSGGGQHSILRTKTFGRGTELLKSKSGDGLCVIYYNLQSINLSGAC